MSNERILVFNRKLLDDIGVFQGLNFDYKPYIEQILKSGNIYTELRNKVEFDYSKKQIIPYVIIAHSGKLLCYVRGVESAEKRLISNASIGIGGHIKQQDDSLFFDSDNYVERLYNAAKDREVKEEIVIDTDYSDELVAVLNDDSNDVGRVHFGIVHVWFLEKPNVRKKERKITQLEFLKPHEILEKNFKLENWSRICLQNIDIILKKEK